jgi:hypothetical protein
MGAMVAWPVVFPGRTVATSVLAAPLVAAAGAMAASAAGQRLRPVRIAAGAFE